MRLNHATAARISAKRFEAGQRRQSINGPRTTATPPARTNTLRTYIETVKQIPTGMYALLLKNGQVDFLEVTEDNGKNWVNRLVGAPGDFRRIRFTTPQGRADYRMMEMAATHILSDLAGAAQRFGKHFQTCGQCGSPLTNPVSRELGIGPICKAKVGL